MIRVTYRTDGQVTEMTEKKWKSLVKKNPNFQGPLFAAKYSVEKFTKHVPSFKFVAWVHPKKGGDDYQVEVDQAGTTIEEAKRNLESWLTTISAVTDDYQEVRP